MQIELSISLRPSISVGINPCEDNNGGCQDSEICILGTSTDGVSCVLGEPIYRLKLMYDMITVLCQLEEVMLFIACLRHF